MKHLLTILFLLLSLTAWTQERCIKAVQQGQPAEVLCVGKEVVFQDCKNNVSDEFEYYIFDYKKGAPLTDASPIEKYTYNSPGKYRVLQILNLDGETDTVSAVFEVKGTPTPAFTTTSCINQAVSVTITDTDYDSYIIDFGDGNTVTAQPNSTVLHTFRSPGEYEIMVTGSYAGAIGCTGNNVQIIETLPPATVPVIQKLTVLEQDVEGRIQLNLDELQPGYFYRVERYTFDFRRPFEILDTIRDVKNSSMNYLLSGVNTSEGTWFLLRPIDPCGTVSQNSNIVSSIALEVEDRDEQVSLSWTSQPGADRYEIYRNGILIETLDELAQGFVDTEVSCGQPYSYYIQGVSAEGATSVSVTKEVVVTSTIIPPAPFLLSTYDLNNDVVLSLVLPDGEVIQQATIERSVAGSPYKQLETVQQLTYTNEIADPEPLCYRATFTNVCGSTSPLSNVSCPIFLEAEKQEEGPIAFVWTGYAGFPDGAGQYTLELLDDDGNVVASYPVSGNTYTDRVLSDEMALLRYRIKAVSADGTQVSYSNLELIEQELQLFVPNAFTPNGDGLNDLLEVKGRLFLSYTILIYNNLGHVVYKATDEASGWDGTFKGQQLPTGAYAYLIIAETSFGTTKRRTGTITLLR